MNKRVALIAGLALAGAAQAQDGHTIYGGVDSVDMRLNGFGTTTPPGNPDEVVQQPVREDYDATMTRARVGYYLNEDFAVEVQFGAASDSLDPNDPALAEVDGYLGLFLVPRAQPFDWLHFQFPLGYAESEVILPDGTLIARDSASYGMNFQFNLAPFVPEDAFYRGLGLSGGFQVYNQSDDATFRGFNMGLFFAYTFGG